MPVKFISSLSCITGTRLKVLVLSHCKFTKCRYLSHLGMLSSSLGPCKSCKSKRSPAIWFVNLKHLNNSWEPHSFLYYLVSSFLVSPLFTMSCSFALYLLLLLKVFLFFVLKIVISSQLEMVIPLVDLVMYVDCYVEVLVYLLASSWICCGWRCLLQVSKHNDIEIDFNYYGSFFPSYHVHGCHGFVGWNHCKLRAQFFWTNLVQIYVNLCTF